MITFFQWFYCSWKAYRLAVSSHHGQGIGYIAVTRHNVPSVVIFIDVGREAWRVSQIAIECHDVRRVF